MGAVALKTQKAGMEPLFSALMTLIAIYEEEEEKLKEEFPGVKIIVKGKGLPPKLVVVYDFIELDKEKRYKLFEFEERLLNRIENFVKETFGEEPPFPPFEIEFVRHEK